MQFRVGLSSMIDLPQTGFEEVRAKILLCDYNSANGRELSVHAANTFV